MTISESILVCSNRSIVAGCELCQHCQFKLPLLCDGVVHVHVLRPKSSDSNELETCSESYHS